MKRIIATKVSGEDEILEICKALEKMGIDCIVKSKNKNLRVYVFGYDKESLTENYRAVRTLLEKIKRKYNKDKEGYYKYYLSELKYPVNKDLVIDTLKELGYRVIHLEDEGAIKTDVPLDEFNKILEDLHNLYNELRFSKLGSKPVKNLVVLVSYLKNKPLEDVIEEALDKGFLREEEDKIVLNKDINLAKKELLKGEYDGDKNIREER
ncbi:DUF2067 family protein [Methanocaldococcus indicus]|uniref:DUF2067 family protein n=1 Tax=Methanocaldococcus indicus TaxID=213231 RepID=UPI003C6D31BB